MAARGAPLDPDVFTYEAWEWAFTMLFSRAIRLRSATGGETLAMVPYADLINHSPYSAAYVDARKGERPLPPGSAAHRGCGAVLAACPSSHRRLGW